MENSDTFEAEVKEFLEMIYLNFKYDFRRYSHASMRRRVIQACSAQSCETVSMLHQKILTDPTSFSETLEYLTVPVSEMFRDPSYYRTFREKVIPVLRTYPSLKIWVAGCSTGEEAYSLAIVLKEEDLLERTIIYATDINPKSLTKAEAGIFSLSDIRKFTVSYQKSGGLADFSDYYTADHDSAIIQRSLKKNITFTDHSLATDSVFSEIHFVSCRNVLIYFERDLQDRAISLFYDSLCRKGFMGLGSKETIDFSKYSKSFNVLNKTDRVYQKNEYVL